jgi:hypothetical protein
MHMDIPESVAQRLARLAQERGTTVGEVLESLLNRYEPEVPPGSLAALARNAREAGLSTPGPVDTSARSREILDTEYADSLLKRLNVDADTDG